MKITFKEIVSDKEWFHREMLNSLTGDLIEKAQKDQFYEVDLIINGVKVEPKLFNDIVNNIEKYIDREAEHRISAKFADITSEVDDLNDIINDVKGKIADKWNIKDDD